MKSPTKPYPNRWGQLPVQILKMRSIIITFLLIISGTIHCQVLNLGDTEIKGNIVRIIEYSISNNGDYREFRFDSLSNIISKRSYRESNLVQEIYWHYSYQDSVQIVEEKIGEESYFHKSYFDSEGRLAEYKLYNLPDTVRPFIHERNIDYEGDKILGYERIHNHSDGTQLVIKYYIDYDSDSTRASIRNDFDSQIITLKYDKEGNLKKRIIDYNDPSIVIDGARTWSRLSQDKYCIGYKYDSKGNWTKEYSIIWWRRILKSRRKIEYQ